MVPPDNPDNLTEEINEHTTPTHGYRLYHLRTLLWTYLVWAFLNLWLVSVLCKATNNPLIRMPYYWALLHILPLYGLIRTLCEGDMNGFIHFVPGVIGGLSVVAGLLIRGRWACSLIIVGRSIWFFEGYCIYGLSV